MRDIAEVSLFLTGVFVGLTVAVVGMELFVLYARNKRESKEETRKRLETIYGGLVEEHDDYWLVR